MTDEPTVAEAFEASTASLELYVHDGDLTALRRAVIHAEAMVRAAEAEAVEITDERERLALIASAHAFEGRAVRLLGHALAETWTEIEERLTLGAKVETIRPLIDRLEASRRR